ncbi:hypothetical protein RHMOL_Rhmol13G0280000 [Rhododendron molle]|uniref:Uncharacterized protein n=2 Tax=Rhododendron molle TaxID=49168 RepID=A0ACC0LCI6_RHOML|nr:hypothetical protein RHMOL_Rhmol13G0280000 [Rhododendron molle]KAI8526068.1 hypothetical protein RHMOL_Rhmol13G0280000 [Rhododendron molle]
MATSSNQLGENMAVSTSKPGGQKYGLSWFDDFQMVDDESVVDQAYKIFRMIADQAKCCLRLHYVLNDKEELVNVIIEKLPVSWEDYAATLKDMQMQKELRFGALVNLLRVEEKKRGQKVLLEKKEYSRYLPLHKAALRGDWATAERFFDQDPGALTAPINEFSDTALLVAAAEGRNTNDFVKKLVDKMPPGSVDEAYGNVLNRAAYVGNTESVKVILSKNPSLVYFRDGDSKRTPFTRAATNGMRDTLLYLLELVKNDEDSSKLFPDEDSAAFLMDQTIRSGYYGE